MRMRRTKRRAPLLAVVIVGALSLAGCGDSGGTEPRPSASPSIGIEPTAAPVEIESVAAIDGAERFEFAGLGIDVPAGMAATTQTLNDGSTQVQLREDGAPRAAVIVTVTAQVGANSTIVDATSDLTAIELTKGGAASGIVRSPATWEGMPYAVVLTCDLAVEVDGAEVAKQAIVVTMSNPDESQVIGASAEAPAAGLESSEAYAALRTLRFDG